MVGLSYFFLILLVFLFQKSSHFPSDRITKMNARDKQQVKNGASMEHHNHFSGRKLATPLQYLIHSITSERNRSVLESTEWWRGDQMSTSGQSEHVPKAQVSLATGGAVSYSDAVIIQQVC